MTTATARIADGSVTTSKIGATVWLVVRTAGYDHGVAYVALTEQDAIRFTETHAPDHDGHHTWDIRRAPIGALLDADGQPMTGPCTVRVFDTGRGHWSGDHYRCVVARDQ